MLDASWIDSLAEAPFILEASLLASPPSLSGSGPLRSKLGPSLATARPSSRLHPALRNGTRQVHVERRGVPRDA